MTETSDRPSRRHITEVLREEITTGRLRPGTRIPSDRSLAQQHGVSHAAARDAVRLLLAEDLLEPQPGGGVRVATPAAATDHRHTASTITDKALDRLYFELAHLRRQVGLLQGDGVAPRPGASGGERP
ncbi:winged helix-turn-helix domain-containing protein [Streptomyces sp. NPDC050204]|uniref:winged helix-turn-helix domain-containing protein n=1 Tax=Streptomyces sp. NPDC050204 TaxID=3155514 RepID=UPI00341CD53B